ncbi:MULTISPECIES: FAD-dependent oxidoreductase [Ensifer]|uniref:FAD-dependent oxidoreductase n=1 Tax=Ensifer adhaerens TaxID=106592 RepID=A0ABY8HBY2_ENSAD|nr:MULTISPECIES: FAD-dependent oxidoreductase [Ensifer]ANK73490.1 glycine cleavage system protein T [Ensifer adhaerens]KDP73031.1 glycine cleavage system protein T [Ensifer adhaerens]KQX23715.1 glycine cleavage system protein T [Ensifer sp. Root423]KQZ56656.1 glycine cleavage system protein T [Ensifer sp. Root558]MBD9544412.1 GcvT family protein [Ensifer sp. ENS04]
MKSHAKVVVIGGGVVGCSVLYHLTKFGWTDAVLLERSELTSGSTWHAAGGMHTINGDPNVAKLQKYTVELYKEIEAYSGHDVGLHMTSGMMLAATKERFDWMKSILAKGRYMGLEAELLTPREAHDLMPLLDPDQFVGAVFDPVEGHLDPYGTTHAYAKSAKKNGAEIYLHTKVEDLVQRDDGCWRVITNQGEIVAEHVVNAAGLWAREVGRMVGLELPVLAMEHMYLITEDMPEVIEFNQTRGKELMHCVDFDGEIYLRQERNGMLMGTYEKACRPWSPVTTPWDFGHELLAEDIDRISPELEVGFRHFPAFNKAGIKKIINGPFTFSPDGNPLVGPVRGLRNFWSACAVMAGFSQGGGVGLALANWMIHGDPGFDVFAMDVSRYGDFATLAYTNAKVRENYSRRFSIRYPNEELPAARPLLTTPIYDRLKAAGAVFGASYGLETPLWFAPEGVKDAFSWRRSTDFETVGAEARAVREGVGLMETSGFAKYAITGKGAEAWLDRMLACRIPEVGRMALAPMLKEDGKLIGDFTLAKLEEGDFLLVGSGIAEDYHMRWFEAHLPADGSVTLKALKLELAGLSIAGPKARDVLESLTHLDVSDADFPFMDIRRMDLGMAPALVGRVSYTGDLGYEIWMKPEYQRYLFELLMEKGAASGIRLFGLRALNALRVEKSFGSWAREYRPLYGPVEAGLGRFVATGKDADFIGKAAALKEKADGGAMRLRTFVLDARDADVIGDEPIYLDGVVRGWVTSGGYAHASGVSVAMGYVPKEIADRSDGWSIELLGEILPARLQPHPLFDSNGQRMRA